MSGLTRNHIEELFLVLYLPGEAILRRVEFGRGHHLSTGSREVCIGVEHEVLSRRFLKSTRKEVAWLPESHRFCL